MRRLVHILLLQSIAAVSLFSGDLTITYKVKKSAMMGVVSHTGAIVEYHSPRHKRVSDKKDQTDTIYDYNDFIRYTIDHEKKIIRKFALEDVIKCREMLTQAAKETGDSVKIEGFGDMSKTTVKNDGVEVILNKKCDKRIISMGKLKAKSSVDPTLAPPVPQGGKVAVLRDIPFSMMPNYADTFGNFFDLVSQKGIPLKSAVEMPIGTQVGTLTLKTSIEATEIVEGAIPDSVFALPNGYAMEDEGKKEIEKITEQIKNAGKK